MLNMTLNSAIVGMPYSLMAQKELDIDIFSIFDDKLSLYVATA